MMSTESSDMTGAEMWVDRAEVDQARSAIRNASMPIRRYMW